MTHRGTFVTCLVAALAYSAAAGVAHADIGGGVATQGGTPLSGASVALTDAAGVQVAATTADSGGRYSFTTAQLTGKTGPFAVQGSIADPCRVAPEAPTRLTSASGLADGVTQNLTLDVTEVCGAAAPAGQPAPTGFVDAAARRVLAGPGAVVYLRTPLPAQATDVEVRLQNGAVISQARTEPGVVPIVAPTASYAGPLTLTYAVGGAVVSRTLAQMSSGVLVRPTASRTLDVVGAVPVSGIQSRANGSNDAQEWISLMGWLTRPADTFGAFGFDTIVRPVVDPAPVAGTAGMRLVEDLAAATLLPTFASNDPNVAFGQAQRMLTIPGADPKRRKLVVYVAYTVAGGSYLNGHLRLGFNGTAQPWPVCVVELGRVPGFAETARLRRIALDTGGTFVHADTARDVPDRIAQCRAEAAGERTLLSATPALRRARDIGTFTVGRQREVTVLLSAGAARKASLTLTDPTRGVRTSTSPGPGVTFVQRDIYTLVRIRGARPGKWTVRAGVRGSGAAPLRVTAIGAANPS